MPRGPRLDAPGTLHHVMVRGIEGRPIFRDDPDREDFLRRLAVVIRERGLTLYAWAFLPNHVHLLLRTGGVPLSRAMRSLLTGYAGAFNRRHRRRGHLFQNRYKSIVVEEEPYLLELVRYIHLNPVRAEVVPDLRRLDRYPYSGHAVLLGHRELPVQATGDILARFAAATPRARRRYQVFVGEGLPQGRRPELQGGGLIRSLGGWQAVQALRRGREQYTGDERVLGGTEFVLALQQEVEGRRTRRPHADLQGIVARVCAAGGLHPEALRGGGRRPAVAEARAGIAYLWVGVLGQSGRALAQVLGVQPAAVYKAARRGEAAPGRWDQLLKGP